MKSVFLRIKLNMRKNKLFIVKTIVFVLIFSMFFTSMYIKNVSSKLKDSIYSKFDIYIQITSKETGNYSEEDIDQLFESILSYMKVMNKLNEQPYVEYTDINFINNKHNVLLPVLIKNNEIEVFDPHVYANRSEAYTFIQKRLFSTELNKWLELKLDSSRNKTPMDLYFEKYDKLLGRYFTQEEIEKGLPVCIVPFPLEVLYKNGYGEPGLNDNIIISEVIMNNKGEVIYNEPHELKIVGFYNTYNSVFEGTIPVYIPEKQYQKIFESMLTHLREYNPEFLNEHMKTNLFKMSPALFKIKDIEGLRSFVKELEPYKNMFPEEYQYYSTIEANYPVISNVNSIYNSFNYISIICFMLGLISTSIMMMFEMSYRKKEMGILFSLGESIHKVLLQFILEMLIVIALSLPCSLMIAKWGGSYAVDQLISNVYSHDESIKSEDSEYDTILELSIEKKNCCWLGNIWEQFSCLKLQDYMEW